MEAVGQIRSSSGELGPPSENLPKDDAELAKWFVDKMRKWRGYGSDYVEVRLAAADEQPEELVNNHPKVTAELIPHDVITEDEHEKLAYCKACNRSLERRGINGHVRSKAHLAALAKMEEELLAASAA